MLTVTLIDINGNEINNTVPLSVQIQKDEDVPADSAELRLPLVLKNQIKELYIYIDGELVFSGIADEQISEESDNPHTEISARSFAAKLIDSEAYPMSLVNPSMQDIMRLYAEPLNFKCAEGTDKALKGKFTVAKGTSCFNVIKSFCEAVYGAFPRIEENTVYPEGLSSHTELYFSNSGGIPYQSIRAAHLRCNRLSKVIAKLKDGEGYTAQVNDTEAQSAGITAVRYINAVVGASASLKDADVMLAKAKKESFYITAKCKGAYANSLGACAKVQSCDELFDTLYVSAIKYIYSDSGEYTRLTLRRKEIA